jgi:hypothetical protein
MEILVNAVLYTFYTLVIIMIVISLIEYPGIWALLIIILLSPILLPIWLPYKVNKILSEKQ